MRRRTSVASNYSSTSNNSASEPQNNPVIRLHLNRKRDHDKCSQLRHAASDTCQIGGALIQDTEQLFVTELLTDYKNTVNVEIPEDVLMSEDDINLYNSMKNEETVVSEPERKSLWKYIKLLNTANAMRNSSVCAAGDVLREIGRK